LIWLQGVESDRAAVEANGTMSEPVEKVFREAKLMLELIHAPNQMSLTDGFA
jgi:hypothetical protein